MSILSKLFGRGGNKPTTIQTSSTSPYRIRNPVAGFVCVAPELQLLMEEDKAALGHFFFEARSSTVEIAPCDVLFLYCKVEAGGRIGGQRMRIRDFIKASGACIAIVASENDGESYMNALEPKGDWPANIVLVADRRGNNFIDFFSDLLGAMSRGKSMLMAWVELAPQIPGQEQPNAPVTLLLPEAGHVAFDGPATIGSN